MSDYALSTNLYTFAQSSEEGFFAWPISTGEAETINKLQRGDFLVPKFAQAPIHPGDEGGADWQRQYCETIGVDYDTIAVGSENVIAGGAGATPLVLRVTEQRPDDTRPANGPWAAVESSGYRSRRP